MAAGDNRSPKIGGPARLVAGFGFLYAFTVAVLLLLLDNFFRGEPNSDAMLLWLLVPLVASFTAWMAVRSGIALLRISIWFGVVATAFCCWIAVFSYGMWFLPLPFLLMGNWWR